MSHTAAWLPLGMLLGVAVCSGCASSSQRDANNGNVGWAMYNMSYDGVRSSPLTEINVGNVKNLRPVCRAKLGEEGSFTAGPRGGRDTLFRYHAPHHSLRSTPRPAAHLALRRSAHEGGRFMP